MASLVCVLCDLYEILNLKLFSNYIYAMESYE